MRLSHKDKKTKSIYGKISLQIFSIIYLLFLITHLVHSPTTAYFTDSNAIQSTISTESEFYEEVQDSEETPEPELNEDETDKGSEKNKSELGDEQSEQEKNNKGESSDTEMESKKGAEEQKTGETETTIEEEEEDEEPKTKEEIDNNEDAEAEAGTEK